MPVSAALAWRQLTMPLFLLSVAMCRDPMALAVLAKVSSSLARLETGRWPCPWRLLGPASALEAGGPVELLKVPWVLTLGREASNESPRAPGTLGHKRTGPRSHTGLLSLVGCRS